MPTEEDPFTALRRLSIDNALQSFGYNFLFDRRARRYKNSLRWIAIFGIAVPAFIGLTAIGYGFSNFLQKAIWVSGILIIIQFFFSLFAIIFSWDDELAYSYEASQSYNSLEGNFKKLAYFPPSDIGEFGSKYDLIDAEYSHRSQQDSKHSIKDTERRRGMRAALREYKRECESCKIVPTSMKPTKCDVCGDF